MRGMRGQKISGLAICAWKPKVPSSSLDASYIKRQLSSVISRLMYNVSPAVL